MIAPPFFEVGDLERDPVLFAVACEIVGEELARDCLVLDDGDAHHGPALPHVTADGNKNK